MYTGRNILLMRGFKSQKLENYFTLGHIIDETFYTVELMHACVRRLQAQALLVVPF